MNVFELVYRKLTAGPVNATRVYADALRAGFPINAVSTATQALAVSDGRVMRLRDGFIYNPAGR